jgi:phosphatidylglycerol:prolipoprotein diacylglycerol transferase
MIPYVHVADPGFIHPFGLLVATGVLIGIWLATKRARGMGYDVDRLNSFITWMLVCGFIGGHVLDELFYHPHEVADDPLSLLMLWKSLSSFGGFIGAFIGIVLWKYYWFDSKFPGHPWLSWIGRVRKRTNVQPILPFADLILSVFPVSWVFGRMGCSSVHDHPGALAVKGAFLSVEYPAGFPADASPEYVAKAFHGARTSYGFIEFLHGETSRYDLGLLEMLFTVCLASLLALTWKKKVPVGTYIVATALTYGPVRFVMDYLRITEGVNADPRYSGFTPAQWCCLALSAFGLAMVAVMFRNRARGFDPASLVLAGTPSGEEIIARKKLEAKAAEKAAKEEEEEEEEDEDEEREKPAVPQAKPAKEEAASESAPPAEPALGPRGPDGFPDWKKLYESGDVEKLPWFSEKLDKDLAEALDKLELKKGKALDQGTGPGTQAIALAKRGFEMTGSDISPAAIEYAKKRADKEYEDAVKHEGGTAKKPNVTFVVDDVLATKLEGPFDFIFDRGCFHVFAPEKRKDYVATVKKLLPKDGRLFLKTFSHEQPGTEGPHRFTKEQIRDVFSDDFEVVSIHDTVYEGQLEPAPKALFSVLRKKG